LAFVGAHPQLSAGSTEIEAEWLAAVRAERLAFDGEPPLLAREAAILPLPGRAGVARAVGGRTPAGAGARPHGAAVHREHPRRVRIAWMHHDRKTDVADLGRHVAPDPFPRVAGAVDAIDAAVVLLIQAIR